MSCREKEVIEKLVEKKIDGLNRDRLMDYIYGYEMESDIVDELGYIINFREEAEKIVSGLKI